MRDDPASGGRARIREALSHRDSRVPFDLGSTAVTGDLREAVHDIQARAPIQYVVAMVDALREHNGESRAGR